MSTNTALSIRPWTYESTDRIALQDVLARVNLERGHFRDITEASLQEEIAAEGGIELSDSDDDSDDAKLEPAVAEEGQPATREELYAAKREMHMHVSSAEQQILMALDFVSLLQSTYATNVAATTVSPALKSQIPLSSLATDIVQRTPVDQAREAQEELMATNVRMSGLQQSADALLAAATRLEQNVQKEKRYWEQILAISTNGWNVSRIPRQPHLLGVRFGFSESAPQFSSKDLAALISDSDGGVTLERGIGTKPKALRAVIRRQDQTVGCSRILSTSNNETSLESRIRHARDSVYDEELYHELIREGRTLASVGVSVIGSAIVMPGASLDAPEEQIHLDLVPLDERPEGASSGNYQHDNLAQAIVLGARLLLGHAHREQHNKKYEVPQPISDKVQETSRPPRFILRPLVMLMKHQKSISQVNQYLQNIWSLLAAAKLEARVDLAKLHLPSSHEVRDVAGLLSSFAQPLQTHASLHITLGSGEQHLLNVSIETPSANMLTSLFRLSFGDTRQVEFTDFHELVDAADAVVLDALRHALVRKLGSEWSADRSGDQLIKRQGQGRGAQIRLQMQAARGVVLLQSTSDSREWKADGKGGEARPIWEVCEEMAH